jgi:hypothetical protein
MGTNIDHGASPDAKPASSDYRPEWKKPVVDELKVEELVGAADLEVAFTSSYSSGDVD